MSTVTVKVSGMSCGHCAASVRQEVAALPGVSGVDVDIAEGTVTISSAATLPVEAIDAAIRQAGYALAG
ncbi:MULTISPECIES: heavy-metal-associated domain-containing protein [Mycobacteriaceae]|uniref:heavy-metal-associated domain-containing protein n=1 Tax=Mycobacteriaceae TaxID=1762 RepID=UPI0009927983|nr:MULTISPECIES: cation transporter [Mycobacteriaceae]MDM2175053.1 cation transporter [Mycobacteroides abscessus]SKL50984.1 Putative metal-binding protein [Mycobacteroides abscessus subsp. bolletii]MDM2179752.1 cation transporter [Mycobacteroides abscessus]MDM2207817.1 cation transporter [Mycobacteroides abscessus]MDM2211437.1 cation transporter [Mycobacteroides abscessus]